MRLKKPLIWVSVTTSAVAVGIVAGLGVLAWQRVGQIPASCHDADGPMDVGLVLSGGPHYRRTRRAVTLYDSRQARRLSFSNAGRGGHLAQRLGKEARRLGVRNQDVVIESQARSAVQNFRNRCALPAWVDSHRIAIVTDRFHAYRAWLTAKRQCPERTFCSAPVLLPISAVQRVSETKKLLAYQLPGRSEWW